LGKTFSIKAHHNIKKAGTFREHFLNRLPPPVVNVPGNGFPLPTVHVAHTTTSMPGVCEIVASKDPSAHDVNPSNFSFFKVQHGLKQGTVRSVCQDQAGRLWFGTYGGGASCYDGKYFTNYGMKQGLSSDVVFSIVQDSHGNYWFGTNGGGVTKYDGRVYTYYNVSGGLADNAVNSICESRDCTMLFATNNCLSAFDGKYFTNYSKNNGLCADMVFNVTADGSGRIWCGTPAGVSCFDRRSFTNYTENQGLINNVVLDIYKDGDSALWFGTLNGASRLNGKSFMNISAPDGLGDNVVYDILRDTRHQLWFCTSDGLTCYSEGTFTYHTGKDGLSNNMVFCGLAGKEGSLWFGTNGGGVSQYMGNTFTNFGEWNGLPGNVILSMLESGDSLIWFGSMGGGLVRYNGTNMKVFSAATGICGNTVYDICRDSAGGLWLATDAGGVCRFDGSSITTIEGASPLDINTVNSIWEDRQHRLWFATEGSGVLMLQGDSCIQYKKAQGLADNAVYTIRGDSMGGLWFGTYGGASYFNGSTFVNYSKSSGLPDNLVLCIMKTKNGVTWLGTNSGACYIKNDSVIPFTASEGFNNNAVLSMVQDNEGNIWFGSRKGLIQLDAKFADGPGRNTALAGGLHNFGNNEGFPGGNCRRNSVLKDSRGHIWWGADQLECLDYKGLALDTTVPEVQITGLRLYGENIDWSARYPKYDTTVSAVTQRLFPASLKNGIRLNNIRFDGLTRWTGLPENLSLPYRLTNLTFDFNAVHLQDREFIRYRHRLNGYDDEWSQPGDLAQANYANLPGGTYTFEVKAMNQEGKWSSSARYSFEVREAWWRTWWFRLSVLVFAVVFIRVYIWWRERISRRMNEALEKKNQELMKINSELDRFVYSASHELRSPLTSVLGLLQLTKAEATDNGMVKKLNMMQAAIERLDNFILDIINYSKNSRLKIVSQQIDFNALIEGCRQHFEYMPEMQHIRFSVSVDDQTGFYSDAKRIEVLFNNLISNAVKYSKTYRNDAEVKINIATDEEKAFIEISDNGTGIPEKYIHRIFDMFFRATQSGSGSGLGLYICREIVEKLGGNISVTSVQNKGTTFYITLPNRVAETAPALT
jgi:signal transduction histidine kinase/ligand-binding sensor domain-containing protein